MRPLDLLIFDFDGTLAQTGLDIARSVNYTLESLGLPRRRDNEIIQFIGDGVHQLIGRSLGTDAQAHFTEAMDIFADHYMAHLLDTTTLYPGVIDLLGYFRQPKVIVTNKRFLFTTAITDALHVTGYFREIIGADSTPYIKPDARLITPLLEKYRAEPSRTLIVGDGVNDILVAKNSGILSCAFFGGLTGRDALMALNPDFSCESLTEIRKFFY